MSRWEPPVKDSVSSKYVSQPQLQKIHICMSWWFQLVVSKDSITNHSSIIYSWLIHPDTANHQEFGTHKYSANQLVVIWFLRHFSAFLHENMNEDYAFTHTKTGARETIQEGGKYNIHLFLVIFNHRLLKFCTFLSSYIIILDLFLWNELSENYCFLEVKFHNHMN